MKLVYLTTNDPLYLPAFFKRVLNHTSDITAVVCVVPPLYKRQTLRQAVLKYYRTFGFYDTAILSWKVFMSKLRRQSVANVCRARGIPCLKVADVNAPAFLDHLRSISPDILISVSCPQIFLKPLIDLPRKGILNLHGALLPSYRGIIPSFWMMANGETKAGVSIYFVNEKIDAGELCGQKTFNIGRHESLDEFIRRSKAIAADLLIRTLLRIEKGKIRREPLDLTKGSYYSWPDSEAVNRFRTSGHQMW